MADLFSRREFLRLLTGGLGYALCGKVSAAPTSVMQREILPDGLHYPAEYDKNLVVNHLRQIIAADPFAAITIMWQMPIARDDVRVEFRRQDRAGASWVQPSYERSKIADGEIYIYTAHLTRLTADCQYAYRIVWSETATIWRKFATAPYGDFRGIILCDSQCGDSYEAWRTTIHNAIAQQPCINFIADIGDIVDNGQSHWHWEEWLNGAEDILPDYLFVPVMGNHECYDLNWQNSLPVGYLEQFSSPPNGSRDFLGYYYDFYYGCVHFYVLNTQFFELDGLRPGLLAEQAAWFRQTAKKNNRPWQIVMMHRDILAYNEWNPYTKNYGGLNDIAHDFMPLFDELGIDLVLTGHMHTYRNRGRIYDFRPAEYGPTYVLCGLSGNAHYDVPLDKNFDRVVLPQPETDNYLLLSATSRRLELQCYLTNGKIMDEIILDK